MTEQSKKEKKKLVCSAVKKKGILEYLISNDKTFISIYDAINIHLTRAYLYVETLLDAFHMTMLPVIPLRCLNYYSIRVLT